MHFRPFNQSVSILAYEKNNKKYAATYAWFSQVGEKEVIGLLGAQSQTANSLAIGDIVGISVCSKEQLEISEYVGSTHSSDCNKLENVKCIQNDTAILLENSKCVMKCMVKSIIHLPGIEEDHLVYFEVLEFYIDETKDTLLMSDYD